MTLPLQFGLLDSAYNDFLYALIGEDENGRDVSVISALTRLGSDPWDEARRLGKLSSAAATKSLAGMIEKLSPPRWEPDEASQIARRLIPLLPKAGAPAAPRRVQTGSVPVAVALLARRYWGQSILLALLIMVVIATLIK